MRVAVSLVMFSPPCSQRSESEAQQEGGGGFGDKGPTSRNRIEERARNAIKCIIIEHENRRPEEG